MGVDTILLLLAGSVVAVAAIAIAASKGVFSSKTGSLPSVPSVDSQVISPQLASAPAATSQVTSESNDQSSNHIQEAPAPFPEDSAPTPNQTSVPTDISAIGGITAATTSSGPVLVIATPKPKTRKRLPSGTTTGVPRKRRSTKATTQTTPNTTIPTASTETTSTDTTTQQ